jgi:hypothetical protein
MTGLLNFCEQMQFSTSWGADICKILILFSMIQIIVILTKLIIKWQV